MNTRTDSQIVKLSPTGRHAAVEPLPYKAGWLRRKYPGVEVFQVAVGDADGMVDFYFNHGQSGFSGLAKPAAGGVNDLIQVPCRRLGSTLYGSVGIAHRVEQAIELRPRDFHTGGVALGCPNIQRRSAGLSLPDDPRPPA